MVAKPPEIAPFGALRFAELALEAGLPPGVLNVVPGGAGGRRRAACATPASTRCRSPAGAPPRAASWRRPQRPSRRSTFELGGKSANIIFPDADLDAAAPTAAMLGAVLLSGQGCALGTRLYVHDDVYDEVVERVWRRSPPSPIGDPLDPSVLMGPVVDRGVVRTGSSA